MHRPAGPVHVDATMTQTVPIRVVVVDDHPMLRDGTVAFLEEQPDIEVVGVADDGRSALAKVKSVVPDVVLLDLRLPDMSGVDVARELLDLLPELAIVIITGYSYLAYENRLGQMGIDLILDKAASGREITTAVRQAVAARSDPAEPTPARHLGYPLTLREGQVLEMLAEGKHNHEVASALGVSSKTVEFHVTNLMAKLGARSRMNAVFIAQELGLIDLSRVAPSRARPAAGGGRRRRGPGRAGRKEAPGGVGA